MIKKLVLTAFVLIAGLLSTVSQASLFDSEPQFLPRDQAFVFDFEQRGDKLLLKWQIEDGYYLYRHQLKFNSDAATLGEPAIPEGKDHYDEYFGHQQVYYQELEVTLPLLAASGDAEVIVGYQGCADAGLCYPPTKKTVYIDAQQIATALAAPKSAGNGNSGGFDGTEQGKLASMLGNASLPWTLLVFFGLGVALAFTPCVFPMYPILSGIIVGQGDKLTTRHAFALSFSYIQGMALTYSALGLVVASAGVQFQAALQHPAILITLAVVFVVLSCSMFGLYNLQLPSSWQEKLTQMSNRQKGGSLAGVFTMGMISGLVASPCTTAPLTGALLYVAQSGDLLLGGLALYALSLGMGLPLLLLGTSGGKLLPRAGAWMDTIKGVFGFMLLLVAIILVERLVPVFYGQLAWAAWLILLAGYLLHQNGKTQFSKLQTVRQVTALLLLIGGVYLGASPWITPVNSTLATEQKLEFIKIKSSEDLDQQLAAARRDGVPVMLDLYADWCVACKEFEKYTFHDASVEPLLRQMRVLQADVTANDDIDIRLQEDLNVLGLPSILMFDLESAELRQYRVVGFQPPEQFSQLLKEVLASAG